MSIENLIQNLLAYIRIDSVVQKYIKWIKSHRNYTMCNFGNEIILIEISHGNVLIRNIRSIDEMKNGLSWDFEIGVPY